MANSNETFDLKKLKADPELWKRLATPNGEDNTLGAVFEGEDNPFEKDSDAAIKKVQRLASEGKLYVREYGRATHYKKVEVDGDKLKLEGTYKQEIGGSDPAMGLLMRLSRAYFKWIGFDKISGWFDKRLKARDERIKKRAEYKAKYKKLSKAEKKELKKIKKQEEQLEKAKKKLAELEKQTQKAKETVNQLLNKMGKKILGEMESPLSQPANLEDEKSSLQPVLTGDELQKQQEKTKTELETSPVHNGKTEKEISEEEKKKKTPEKNDSALKITIGGKEYTSENIHEAPEKVRKVLEALEELAKQMEKKEQTPQESKEPQTGEKQEKKGSLIDDTDSLISDESTMVEDSDSLISDDSILIDDTDSLISGDSTLIEDDSLIDLEDFPETRENQAADVPEFDFTAPEKNIGVAAAEVTNTENIPQGNTQQAADAPLFDFSVFEKNAVGAATDFFNMDNVPQENTQQVADVPPFDFSAIMGNAPDSQMSAPLNQPAPIEKDKVGIHSRPKEQEVPGLKERLFAEEEKMNAARNWKEFLANALFSHEDGKEMRAQYNRFKDMGAVGNEYLSGAVFGVLTKASADPENKQQVMDALLNGTSVGDLNPDLIRDGTMASTNAWSMQAQGNKTQLEEMMSKAVKELSQQASQETALSPRCVMIGRLISNAMLIAEDNKLDLHLTEKETVAAQGAINLSKLAQKHHNARQYLGKNPADLTSERGREAVRDLLTGNAIEQMILKDKSAGEFTTNTQLLMGKGVWSEENLAQMTNRVLMKKNITQGQVMKILSNPEGVPAQKSAARVMEGIISETVEQQNALKQAAQKDLTNQRNMANPEHNPL